MVSLDDACNFGRRRASQVLAACLSMLAASLTGDASASNGVRDAPAGAAGNEISVSVPYVTNRKQNHGDATPATYTGERGSPGFGRCDVAFRPIPVVNKLAPQVPFYIPAETRKVRSTHHIDAEFFWDHLSTEVQSTSSGSAVVFVHGYSYGFERNCRAAAELQRALMGKAVVLMFSWPSNGKPTDYLPDQADLEWSVPFLARVLAQLGDLVGHRNVQVLAHSLGSRGVVFALDHLSASQRPGAVIGPLVLIAPDFDAQTFVDRLPTLVPLTGGITLYASSLDTPLKVSQQLHQYPRLGVAGEFLTVAEGMQTVDVSPVGRYQVLGHEYFLFHPRVAADLAMLLGDGLAATERPGLRAVHRDGLTHWELTEAMDPGATGDR